MVPARYMFVKRSSSSGGGERVPRAVMKAMNDAVGAC
jgi:hypothetical protein